MKITYKERRFAPDTLAVIDRANQIIDEYGGQGFALTLRQLYYQFVARGILPNTEKSYKRLGSIINDARLAGLVDWLAIEDRTRWLRTLPHWDKPADIIEACAKQFRVDLWESQNCRPEVWIEKDALVGVIEGVCNRNDVPYFACRGYVSQSEQWRAGRRFLQYGRAGQVVVVLHLGDHDPSGIDMTFDNTNRLQMFAETFDNVEVRRLALNMDQVEQYNPPPNPTKLTDSRAGGYLERFGNESWELDALEPRVIADLIEQNIALLRDPERHNQALQRQQAGRDLLQRIADENQ